MFKKVGSIKNLEVASVCQLSCPYCPQAEQHEHRQTGLMEWTTFERALFWLERFVRAGTQHELNLFGVGEPLLHPQIVEMAAAVRRVMPRYLPLLMNTNGILVSEEIVRKLFDAGIDKIDVTDHEARPSTEAIRVLRRVTGQHMPSQAPGSRWGYSRDSIINPNNWGGLVDWVPSVEYPRYVCPWLSGGCVMVCSSGDVTRCCQDAFGRGVLGSVFDEDLDQKDHTPYVQCATCHEDVPAWMPKPSTEEKTKTEKEKTA